jgi:pimeloyl-ACP methyl ester carboxylesterase
MPEILCNGLDHYYELSGEGLPLVFIHGAFVDARIWNPQWRHFSTHCRVLRYDLRGHGRTGGSELQHYSMDTYASDLESLLDGLGIDSAVICGLSWGGGIAQVFAVNFPQRVKGLVLAGSTVSMSLTPVEKLLRYALFPKPAMAFSIRLLGVAGYVRFSNWLAGLALGKHWLSGDEHTRDYLEECMLQIDSEELIKIWGAIYGFDLQPLESIKAPTLVMNAERDSRMALRHGEEILRRVPGSESRLIPKAYHAMTLENPAEFNSLLEAFLQRLG